MKTNRQFRIAALLICLALLLVFCEDPKAGSFNLDVTFNSAKPTDSCWLTIEVRQLQQDSPALTVWALPPTPYPLTTDPSTDVPTGQDIPQVSPNGALDLSGIPYGDDYVVVVNLRDSMYANGTLLFSGASDRFSLHEGKKNTLSVLLSRVQLSLPSEEVPGTSPTSVADLYLALNMKMFSEFAEETTVAFSNSPDFENADVQNLSSLEHYKNGFKRSSWDLNAGVCGIDPPCMDGDRYVYARVVNSVYGENDINLAVRTSIDSSAPFLLEPYPEIPALTNKNVVFDVSFSEPVTAASITPDCDGLGAARINLQDGRLNAEGEWIGTAARITCPVEAATENRVHTLSISARDQSGRSTGSVELGNVLVDTVPPKLNGAVLYSPSITTMGDVVDIEFYLTEPAKTVDVMFGSIDISSKCKTDPLNNEHYTCAVTTTSAYPEGFYNIAMTLEDEASNHIDLNNLGLVILDYTVPQIIEAKVTPTYARTGSVIEVDVTLSEVPADFSFDGDGLPLTDLLQVPNTPNRYRGSYVVKERDVNKSFDLSVSFKDTAGNRVEDASIGKVTIDTLLPYLTEPIVTDRAVARLGEDFSFTFSVSEPIEYLTVNVGLVSLDINQACSVDAEGLHYTCVHHPESGPHRGNGIRYGLFLGTRPKGHHGLGRPARCDQSERECVREQLLLQASHSEGHAGQSLRIRGDVG